MKYLKSILRHHHWFYDHIGLKVFAQLAKIWPLQSPHNLTAKLKKKHSQFAKYSEKYNAEPIRRHQIQILNPGELLWVKARGYILGILSCVIAEVVFNYSESHSILPLNGLLSEIAHVLLALIFTISGILFLEHFIKETLYQTPCRRRGKGGPKLDMEGINDENERLSEANTNLPTRRYVAIQKEILDSKMRIEDESDFIEEWGSLQSPMIQ
ncbi:MAG: hypothetical protein H6581_05395 [Bacteroidia bacterium]|nr:hypothetical protein [Bacteroidia bacterium]